MALVETGLGGSSAQDGDASLADLLSYTIIGIMSRRGRFPSATGRRLAEQPAHLVVRVLAMGAVEQLRDRCVGEPEGVIQLAVSQQTALGADLGAVEFELDPRSKVGLSGSSLVSTKFGNQNSDAESQTFVQAEPSDHLIVLGGCSLPVYVALSGKVTVIVELSTMDPWAAGRPNADISIVRDENLVEKTALRVLPSVQLPFRFITVIALVSQICAVFVLSSVHL